MLCENVETMVETFLARRGRILLEIWPDAQGNEGRGPADWVACDHGGHYVDAGSSGSRAYAITDANKSLIRLDIPFF